MLRVSVMLKPLWSLTMSGRILCMVWRPSSWRALALTGQRWPSQESARICWCLHPPVKMCTKKIKISFLNKGVFTLNLSNYIKKGHRCVEDGRVLRQHNRIIHWRSLIRAAHFSRYCLNFKNVRMKNGNGFLQDPKWTEWQKKKKLPTQHILLIRCAYPESVPARHGGVTALAAGKVHQVDLAGDAVLVLLSLHQLRLGTIREENKNCNLQIAHLLPI